MLNLDVSHVMKVVREHEFPGFEAQALCAVDTLMEGSGEGSDFLGWRDLPLDYDKQEFERILKAAERIRENSDLLIVAGIGGSYLGARAVIDALSPQFETEAQRKARKVPEIIYAGNNLSPSYLAELMEYIGDREVTVNVISKSGGTTETAVAFRILRSYMEERYGAEGAARRIYATTDKARGALKTLADAKGYETFVIPDEVGGRFSVLTAVGLLPIAAAGIDIVRLMEGAAHMKAVSEECEEECPALLYAVVRNLLYRRGYTIEVMANFEPRLHYFTEWWKQLYGESEGKDGKGIFPAGVDYSTDLHSMGQFMQDGSRIIFETFIDVEEAGKDLDIPADNEAADGLDYLSGTPYSQIASKALLGTMLAHEDGGTPNMRISIPRLDAFNLGELIYFFEKACGLSAYMNGVNPFNQPGVEAYKKNMFALLGKPGYEELKAELEQRL